MQKSIKKIAQLALYVELLVIEFLATTTTVHIEIVESMWDKANHFIAFFTLYITFYIAYSLKMWQKFMLLLLFGMQIEIVQYFIGREFSLYDLLADGIGITIGVVLSNIFLKFR